MLGVIATVGLAFVTGFQTPSFQAVSLLTPAQKAVLNRLSVVQIPDGQGGTVEALRVTSNFQVVNGLDSTETVNSLGNLIVGYNEETGGETRTGSHNLILGTNHTFSNSGGAVLGRGNAITELYASVLGGSTNESTGQFSVVVNGIFNDSTGAFSTVVGGATNIASGEDSVVVGGEFNQAIARDAVSVGGQLNVNNGDKGVIVGGQFNTITAGTGGVLDGGANRTISGTDDWAAGSLFEDN